MKDIFKKIVIFLFRLFTSLYLKKNKVEVIAITGSAGKTTVKIAIAHLLQERKTYVPVEDYNTEIGLPLVVFKEKSPDSIFSLPAWLKILSHMLTKTLFSRAEYDRIVLEMGADRPGDISYLTSFVKPHISVVTTILPVHMENFKSIKAIADEKSRILIPLTEKDLAVLNYDDKKVRQMSKATGSQIIWVGQSKQAELRASQTKLSLDGLAFNLFWKGKEYPVNLQIIAPQLLISLLSALAVCLYLGEDLEILISRLESFKPQAGRMNLLPGLNDSTIIDDSYNANPQSTLAALEVLLELEGRKIAVLGSMNELGHYEKESHLKVGRKAAGCCDLVVTVGETAKKYIATEALKKLDKKFVQSFFDPYSAGHYLQKKIKKGDIILVKGSQNKVFTEEMVKIIMKEPERADELLVRQNAFWQKKKKRCFNK
jgi:UDP-N-acetylmuramoyl-tripeptide--D-alanyl-D-alanine ligase